MSDKPAAFLGDFVDARFMHGLKSMRLYIDVPIEDANGILKAFGAPDKVNPAKVGVALMDKAALMRGTQETQSEPVSTPQAKPETKRSSLAAIKCADRDFQAWLKLRYYRMWKENPLCDEDPQTTATIVLKTVLGIASRKELDIPGPTAERFLRLLTDYDLRNTVRA